MGRALAGHDEDAFLEIAMKMRPAQRLARQRHRDLDEAEGDGARALLAGDDLERFAAGEAELLRIRLRQDPRHQTAWRRRLISATPPSATSRLAKISVASLAMASAMAVSMRSPFSTVACSGRPYQPVGAIERMSVSTGW